MYVYQRLIHYTIMVTLLGITKISETKKKRGMSRLPKSETTGGETPHGFTRPGKLLQNYGKSQFFMGKSTISMAIFNSYVKLPEGIRNGLYFSCVIRGLPNQMT